MTKLELETALPQQGRAAATDWLRVGFWLALALLATLWVFIINGGPLYYYDTAGYFAHGNRMFGMLGLFQPDPATAGSGGAAASSGDGMVVGSRSAVYALFLSLFLKQGGLWLAVLAQSGILVAALYLAARAVLPVGTVPERIAAAQATALATVAAALGSASFYTAYLMPDIFLPVLLLVIAVLVAFAARLRLWQTIALLGLGMAAVLTHPSHLAVALLMIPVAVLVPLVFGTGRWWLAGLLVALIAGTGVVERLAFTVAVTTVTDSEVVYTPFFTARLISDGPGKSWLDENCPQAGLVTCDLNALLLRPGQMSPERILFSHDPLDGSFALMTPAQRQAIAGEQRGFLIAVVASRPLGVIGAALGNTLRQMGLVSIDMTIPDQSVFTNAAKMSTEFPPSLAQGRLFGGGPWVTTLTTLHQIYYALAGLALLALLVAPQSRLPRHLRAFGVLVILGVLANAFVTGAISQPANRYGARAIFLIPAVLVLLVMARAALTPSTSARSALAKSAATRKARP